MKRLLALLASCLMGVTLVMSGFADAELPQADIALLAGIPNPPNSKALGAGAISNGGQRASFTTSADPSAVIASYTQILPGSGWTVTGSGGAGSSNGGRSRASGDKRAEVFVDQCRRSARDDLREYLRVAVKAE
jgi:hypothetical protein